LNVDGLLGAEPPAGWGANGLVVVVFPPPKEKPVLAEGPEEKENDPAVDGRGGSIVELDVLF